MIEVELVALRTDLPTRAPFIVLRETTGEQRVLPIGIGLFEAEAIDLAMRGVIPPRPFTHDLLKLVVEELGARLDRVVVSELRDRTFFAELHLDVGGAPHVISARPSDSIALAVRSGSRLFVAEAVLDEAGQVPETDSDDEPEELIDEFRAFIEDISPDDFAS